MITSMLMLMEKKLIETVLVDAVFLIELLIIIIKLISISQKLYAALLINLNNEVISLI